MRPCRRLQQVQILTRPRRIGLLWTDSGRRDQRRVYDSLLQPQQNAKVVVVGIGTDPNCHEPSPRFKLASKVFRGNEKMIRGSKTISRHWQTLIEFKFKVRTSDPIGNQKEKLSTVLAVELEGVHAVNSSGGREEVKSVTPAKFGRKRFGIDERGSPKSSCRSNLRCHPRALERQASHQFWKQSCI